MRWTACAAGVGLLLTAAFGPVVAQSSLPPSTANCPPAAAVTTASQGRPYSAPATLGQPYSQPSLPYTTPTTPLPGAGPPGANAPRGTNAPGASNVPGAQPQGAAQAPSDPGTGADSRGEAGSDALTSAAPQMIGDLISTAFGGVSRASTGTARQAYIRSVLAARSGIKIADNESPKPCDRVFLTYNYFNGVQTFGAGDFGLHRGIVGFEKTFLDGSASVGMRLPFIQGDKPGIRGTDGFGDLSVILKYAFYIDESTGDVASGGLVVSAPTGIGLTLVDGTDLTGVLIQPWGGFIINLDELYAQGFTSLIVPTMAKDITLYTADIGIGYRLYQASDDGWLRSITPTIETHMNMPFSATGPGSLIYFPDMLMSLTGGIHFGLGDQSRLTLAAGVPVTGPKLYDGEFMVQFNMRF